MADSTVGDHDRLPDLGLHEWAVSSNLLDPPIAPVIILDEEGRRWHRTTFDSGEYLEDLDGVDWFRAPIPHRWHSCRPQSRGTNKYGYVERCACGGYNIRAADKPVWTYRNTRRRGSGSVSLRCHRMPGRTA